MKKMWTRADARAEMNQVVKDLAPALRALQVTSDKIRKLGEETDFTHDAGRALEALKQRVHGAIATVDVPESNVQDKWVMVNGEWVKRP